MKNRRNKNVLTFTQQEQEIIDFINLCVHSLSEYKYREICEMTGLSSTTVWRLKSGNYTGCMRVNTVQRLGFAAGFKYFDNGQSVAIKK